ncbi:hypothetical protein JCM11641_000668 [Rhodosporidiobolus odoratus]
MSLPATLQASASNSLPAATFSSTLLAKADTSTLSPGVFGLRPDRSSALAIHPTCARTGTNESSAVSSTGNVAEFGRLEMGRIETEDARGLDDDLQRGQQKRGNYGDFGPGDYGWGTDLTTTTLYVDATSSFDSSTTVYTVFEGVDTTITLTPNIATFTIFATATRYETSVIVQEQTTYQTFTSVYTATLEASTVTTTVLPPETVTVPAEETTHSLTNSPTSSSPSSETLPTTPPPWLTTTSATTSPISTLSSRKSTTTTTTDKPEATTPVPVRLECLPWDKDVKEPGLFEPTHEQKISLYVMGIYFVGITIAWNLWGLRALLYGLKSFTVLVHESGHVLGIKLSGLPLWRFTVDPNAGGASHTTPGRRFPPLALFLGQVFSITFGGAMIFTGFDTLASKYASFVVMAIWLAVIGLQANLLSRLVCFASLAVLVGIWFVEHAVGLRFYILFLGIMSSFYILWDTMEDFFHRKPNECCVVMLESHTAVPATAWFITWFLTSLVVVIGCILAALAYWRNTEHAIYCQGQSWAPT